MQLWKDLTCPEEGKRDRRGPGRSLTEAADFGATPEPVGHALSHPGAHQRVPGVAGEDGRRSVDGQGSDAVPIGRDGELSTGDDYKDHKMLRKPALRDGHRSPAASD